jgi:CheY-like chemotaxis protein/HPt (histidine-containing phosphotransfer) domain-containing protein
VRVLVVDDDMMSRELIGLLLQREGYAVESADSGESALAYLSQSATAFNLILADVQMLGLSGALLAEELHRVCPPTTLLLAMSATRPPEEAIARFHNFILKPFKVAQITAALSAHNPPLAQDSLLDETRAPVQRERWTVVTGPAGRLEPNANLVSISASASPPTASKSRKKSLRIHKESPRQLAPSAEVVLVDNDASTVLNQKTYRRIAASMPAPKVHEMYALCVADARKRIALMRKLAVEHNAALFVREAHAIKGSSGMLGATELRTLAASLELRGLDLSGSEPEQDINSQEVNSLDELSAACDRLERILGSRARGVGSRV